MEERDKHGDRQMAIKKFEELAKRPEAQGICPCCGKPFIGVGLESYGPIRTYVHEDGFACSWDTNFKSRYQTR